MYLSVDTTCLSSKVIGGVPIFYNKFIDPNLNKNSILIIEETSTLEIRKIIDKFSPIGVVLSKGSLAGHVAGILDSSSIQLAMCKKLPPLPLGYYIVIDGKKEKIKVYKNKKLANKYININLKSHQIKNKFKQIRYKGEKVFIKIDSKSINEIKNGIIENPHKVRWESVDIEKIDERTVKFTLKRPYPSFLENTTLGIMPAHLWEGSSMELNSANTSPIGSGPYMISKTDKQSSGIIDSYKLIPFKKFALGEPYIKNINLHFYQNENDLVKALIENKVDQISSITPLNAEILKEKKYQVESSVLPRVFGLFFNQNQNQLFIDKNIIKSENVIFSIIFEIITTEPFLALSIA